MLRKIRSLVLNSDPSYVEVYDNSLSSKECEILVNEFFKSEISEGVIAASDGQVKVNSKLKKCKQIHDSYFEDQSLISRTILPILSDNIDKYKKKYSSLDYLYSWNIVDTYSFQKYEGEGEGYLSWHCEHGPPPISNRLLAWMFYLNDAKSGTEFMNYPTVNAKIGRCVIWPAGWTHLHRSQLPNKGLKYIITGWVGYRPAN